MIFFKPREKKLNQEILDLLMQKKSVEMELKNLQQQIEYKNREQDMKHAEIMHKHKLEIETREQRFAIEKDEITSLLKVEGEQKTKQAEIDAARKTSALEVKHANDIATLERRLQREHYDKLNEALTDLHSKGNVTTQFMQEIALKLMDNTPHKRKTKVLPAAGEK